MKAVSEGTEVSAQDTITAQRQITSHQIKVWIYNSPERDARDPATQLDRPREPHPDRHRHRDAVAADRQLRAVAGGAARGDRARAARGDGTMTTTEPSTTDAATAAELTNASVRLGGKRIFSDVGLTVGRGQFVAVLGPNGAGKSTLMRAILGLLPLESGEVTVLGRPPAQARAGDRLPAPASRVRLLDPDPRDRPRAPRPRRDALGAAGRTHRRRPRTTQGRVRTRRAK